MSTPGPPPISELHPRRVVFAGCWHGNGAWARFAADWAIHEMNAEVIVHTGDFGYTFERSFLSGLHEILSPARVPLYFVDGNHDDHPLLSRWGTALDGTRAGAYPWIRYLPRGLRWRWRATDFLALGGAHSVDRSTRLLRRYHWWPQERITVHDIARAVGGGRAHVMVTHDCPAGVHVPGLRPHDFPIAEIAAAEGHRNLLLDVTDHVQPRYLVHGHYHVRYSGIFDRHCPIGDYTTRVEGLSRDSETLEGNLMAVDLSDTAPGWDDEHPDTGDGVGVFVRTSS